MRAPVPSEPKYTFPTYQVPQVSAMRGRAPPVQVARTAREPGAEPPSECPRVPPNAPSVIYGSSCPKGNSNLRMQSVTDICLLNSVTVPKIQRNVAHNNSDKLAYKSGALLLLGQDIPGCNQKAENTTNAILLPPGLTTSTTTTATSTRYLDAGVDEDYYSYDRLTALCARTRHLERGGASLPAMRLLGGGESSVNTGTSGWGTPPSQQASNNNANTSSGWGTANPANQNNTGTQQWNNNANRPPTSGPGNTNQDANKANSNLPPNGQNAPSSQAGWGQPKSSGPPPQQQQQQQPPTVTNASTAQNQNSPSAVGGIGPLPAPTSNTTKQQLEQLTTMREAIFSQDGWGGQHVNQDTNWDIPSSPEPQHKLDGAGSGGAAPPWKPNVNNGTDLWEANLRNGGQPPPQPQQKTPWGHTPSTNIGGTWGEDDDGSDSSNVWTGVPSGQQQAPQWGGTGGGNNAVSGGTAMWSGPKKDNDWVGSAGGGGGGPGGWDPRNNDPRGPSMDPRDMRGGPDPRDMRNSGAGDSLRLLDPRDQMRMVGGGDMRGDPRGITGRLNGSGSEFWTQGGPQASAHHMHHQGKMPVGPSNGAAGWEEPSPPTQRRNMPNYDDGTSLWGNPQQGGGGGAGASMSGRGGVGGGPPGMGGAPNARVGGMKPPGGGQDGSVWRNGGVVGGGGGGASWTTDESVGPVASAGGWGGDDGGGPWNKPKSMGGAGGPFWAGGDSEMDWAHKQAPKQQPAKDIIWNSKQFRLLVDMGYKKEDVENALRMRDMNMEDALDMLCTLRNTNADAWRPRQDLDHFDHPQYPGQRGFSSASAAQMNFPPSTPNLMNNMGGALSGGSNSLFNNMSPAVAQKMLSQGVGGGSQGFPGGGGSRSMQPQSQPSTAQLRMLVQQIHMAVQAGYLNHQILNQPLAPQTLVLLNQLLQQIKNLQQLANQQSMAQNQCGGKQPSSTFLQYSVFITKTKQQIHNLQNQIASQQANYVKQQQQQQHLGSPPVPTGDIFKTGSSSMHDTLGGLQNNFGELSLKDTQSQQQSRLTQWKLPALDKDDSNDFSRAPGPASKPLVPSHSSPNLNPLGLTQTDGPWSSGRSNAGDTGWPDSSSANDSAGGLDMKDASQWGVSPSQPSLTDLVPEFEPGKPWKGNQKSIEDDPSITPGSVVRSPLSLPTIKDSEVFNMNPSKSPPVGADTIQPLSLSSSTWSFNPPSATSSAFTSPQNKLAPSKGVLAALNSGGSQVSSELWGAPKRGPPPGLSSNKTSSSAANGWSTGGSSIGSGAGGSGWPVQRNWNSSQWLLLRNLTAQIDGSTLRTLCLQHGPLIHFHLYLHQCFALAKYSSHEEAAKAQTALNNCVLGNTTILAENPSEWEATGLLQQVANQSGGSSGTWRGSSTAPSKQQQPSAGSMDTWSTGWSGSVPGAALWGNSPLDGGDGSRATPSSLQPYLPGDLLGGESM